MTRIPSVFSSQLNQFIRRTRENAFELGAVGGTQLENRIQSLFGGMQVRNLPQLLQQIIAQDRALGGGGGSGPLTLVNPFTNDDLTPDQQKAAANQMAVQQGANPPFPEVQQPQGQDSVEEVVRQAASSTRGLVKEGTLTPKGAQGITRQVALNAVLDETAQQRAVADVRALTAQKKDFTFQQIADLEFKIEKDHPSANLDAIPEWRDIKGTEEEWQARVVEARQAESDKWPNLPQDAFKYDERTNQIVQNDQWHKNKAASLVIAEETAKPIIEANRNAAKQAQTIFETDKRQIEKRFQANFTKDPQAAADIFADHMNTTTRSYLETILGLNAPGGAVAQQAPQPAAQPQAAVSALPPQGLPPGKSLFGTFANPQSAMDAKIPSGEYFMAGGFLLRVRLDGNVEPVQ